MNQLLSRGLLALYLVVLTWLVLFKLTLNLPALLDYGHRSLNLIPFAAPSIVNGETNYGEIILNCVFFIPFGLLLNVNFKKVEFLPKLATILAFSLTAEILQYVFAIGATDITDLITNTTGGFLGLTLYALSIRFMETKKLDRVIISVGALLFVLSIAIYLSHFIRIQ